MTQQALREPKYASRGHASAVAILLTLQLAGTAMAWDPANVVPAGERQRFRNPDGSCVQCSIGMMGVDLNIPAAEMLLWDSEYGPAVRGGSWPERVKEYCEARKIVPSA